ncbi:hypothetical protein F4782DRAFT_529785 [Xylaria castorea]|nr:hypothetical protein F4782DRAFT_529785 [Xylaria castorea]
MAAALARLQLSEAHELVQEIRDITTSSQFLKRNRLQQNNHRDLYFRFNIPPRILQTTKMKFSALATAALLGAVSALPGSRPMITAAPELEDVSASVSAKHTSKSCTSTDCWASYAECYGSLTFVYLYPATHLLRVGPSHLRILIVVHLPQLLQRHPQPLRLRFDYGFKHICRTNGA